MPSGTLPEQVERYKHGARARLARQQDEAAARRSAAGSQPGQARACSKRSLLPPGLWPSVLWRTAPGLDPAQIFTWPPRAFPRTRIGEPGAHWTICCTSSK